MKLVLALLMIAASPMFSAHATIVMNLLETTVSLKYAASVDLEGGVEYESDEAILLAAGTQVALPMINWICVNVANKDFFIEGEQFPVSMIVLQEDAYGHFLVTKT